MLHLVVEDFLQLIRTETRVSQYGNTRHGAEYNWEFAETLRNLFML